MTDLIPRDAAIEAVREYITNSGSELEKWDIDQLLQAMPVIDPAAIREAAMREAADKLVHVGYPNTDDEADGPVAVILAIIQKDNTND